MIPSPASSGSRNDPSKRLETICTAIYMSYPVHKGHIVPANVPANVYHFTHASRSRFRVLVQVAGGDEVGIYSKQSIERASISIGISIESREVRPCATHYRGSCATIRR